MPGGRGGHQLRRARARRGEQQRRRRDARSDREGVARHARAAQGVHPRRGAHAVAPGRGGAAEDAGRAAASRRVRARDDRPAEDQRHDPQPHPAPAVPPAARRRARGARALGRRPMPASRSTTRRSPPWSARAAVRHATPCRRSSWRRRRAAVVDDGTPVDEFVDALEAADAGRVLAAVAYSVQQGRDPRALTEDLVRHLRDCFLALMAPELVQVPSARGSNRSGAGVPPGCGPAGEGDGGARRGVGRDAPCTRPAGPGRGRARAPHPS